MNQELWTAVDAYYTDLFVSSDPVLDAALKSSYAAGLPLIQVAPNQGKLLMLLAQIHGARRILEIGTLAGYSTIWLARALPPDGTLITLEANPTHAAVARQNIARSAMASRIDIREGRAIESLRQLAAENPEPFDFIFIDADKPSTPDYFAWSLRLSRMGTVIVVDNVVRDGAVIDANAINPGVQGIRRFNAMVAAEPRVDATVLQTVGTKGHDGFALVLVRSDAE
jgi:predicted O-methyltransferase YrrM